MKKFIAFLVLFAVTLTCLAACSNDDKSSSDLSAGSSIDLVDTSLEKESTPPLASSSDSFADSLTPPTVESQSESSIKALDDTVPNYIGTWNHSAYSHYVRVYEQNGNTIKLELNAIRGEALSIATCEGTVTLVNGKGSFDFTDSFGNSGKCNVSIIDGTMTLGFEMDSNDINFWCVNAAAGTFTLS